MDDAAALGRGEAGELAGRSVGIQAMHALLDQPGDEAAQLGLVDLAVLVQWHQQRGEDSFQFAQFTSFHGSFRGCSNLTPRLQPNASLQPGKLVAPQTFRRAGPRPMQAARKPDSVLDDHSSRRRVTAPLQQPTRKFRLIRSSNPALAKLGRGTRTPLNSPAWAHRADTPVPAGECGRRPCLFGLAPCGVYRAATITDRPVRSCRTFSPLPPAVCPAWLAPCRPFVGGIFSVALAVFAP